MRKEVEMMRVLRVPPMGKLVVEVSGQRFEMLSEINHAKVEQRLLAAIGELIIFAGGYQALVDAGVASPLIPPSTVSSPPPTSKSEPSETNDPELTAQQARFLAELEAQRDSLRSEIPPPQIEDLASAPLPPVAPPPKPAAEQSLADQIDAILQKHLAAEPELSRRMIRLRENPSGGLRIEIDGQFYDRPREIPELAIQRLIKKALKEWENS